MWEKARFPQRFLWVSPHSNRFPRPVDFVFLLCKITMAVLGEVVSQIKAYTWNPIVVASRRTILSLLSQITIGQLVIKEVSTNITTVCGLLEPRQDDIDLKHPRKGPEPPNCELRVNSDVFWVRLLLFADMVRLKPLSCASNSLTSPVHRDLPKAICLVR